MTIENGATLTINGTYNIYKNITIKAGGRIVVNPGAVLKFSNGSSCIVKGIISAVEPVHKLLHLLLLAVLHLDHGII